MTDGPASRRSLVALCTLALAIRLYALGRPSLWFDELLEVERAAGPWQSLLFGRPIDHDPPLFALALRGWIAVGRLLGWPWIGATGGAAPDPANAAVDVAAHPGWAEAWLRLSSVALGVAAVALTAVWASHRFGRRVGLLAALLLTMSPLAIYHSQEVNQYAAMITATPLLLLMHDRLSAGARRRDWLAYGALSAAAIATHYGLVFPLLALGSHLAWRSWRDPTGRTDRGRVAAYAAAMAVVVAVLFTLGLGDRMAVSHVQPRLWGTHLAKELAYIGDVGWREIVVYFPFPFAGGPALVIANALSVLALVGAVRLWRGGGGGRVLVGWFVAGTLAMTYATSVVGWYPLGYRYGLFNLVPYVVLVAAGVVAMGDGLRPSPPDPLPKVWGRGRMLGGWISRIARAGSVVVAATALVAFVAYWPHAPWTAGNPYIHVPREDMRPVLRNVAAAWRAGDRLLVYDGAAAAVRFYWRGDSKDVIALPPFSPGDAATVERMRTALARAADDMRRTPRGDSGRAWLVLSHADPGDEPILQRQLADFGAPSAVIVSADGASASRLEPLPPRP
ncbi:MAG: glycosyltransferase family 39 protein [Ardenticatenales bacterium]|nr:glycosyltransferase family 39 protein [Ardenticatenales bacterium]